jgi:hypothetical protein
MATTIILMGGHIMLDKPLVHPRLWLALAGLVQTTTTLAIQQPITTWEE